ncbi:MAG: HPr-rel-A system PqqD family peptide chaperone [Sulfuriferula multivorans]|uniref:HPr-rel-A system PqqD family peptide chaperone n=1 Tax=Sulfuriferula multivorans TaxID=1559896 RepID=A0A7C9P6Q1_9PROT|nr:HPr-rel-A system PqqD family peptide chaperone [Sulfuriferula multivorans]
MTHASAHPTRLLKSWGDEAVIFDTASGDTHYLKPLTLALYQTCRQHPGLTSDEIAATLATDLNVSHSEQFRELVDETLDTLRRIGLLASA